MRESLEALLPDALLEETAPATRPRRLPFAYAKRNGVLVTEVVDGRAITLCRTGVTAQVLSEVRRHMGLPLAPRLIAQDEFDRMLQASYESDSAETMQMMGEMGEDLDLSQIAQQLPEPEDLLESQDDAPIIRLINALLTEAVKLNASDIHIEPYEYRLVVRFRVDGILREVLEPARVLAPVLVSRVKVMARLDIAEKRLPQDGRISLRIAGRAVDVRVSTLPCGHGERVVMRLLDKQAGRLDLEHLGMASEGLARIEHIIRRPHGIILVTGPTGSGKTTSLYAMLTRMNDKRRNIMTVEDPIEYYIDGISQTQVQLKVDMTFARGLRAILRQDPDIVMVGEIRDLETAEIAVQASLTGHLVLSTLHTNSAIGAVMRLRDMGVEPFLLSSSLIGVLAQRLVRLLCPECKYPHTATAAECADLGVAPDAAPTLFTAQGCSSCSFTGYQGRTAIFEVIEINDRLRTMIHDQRSEQELESYAHSRGASIYQDGVRRVLAGDTTHEEVLRVTHEDN
ncbi:MAG: type II secretion system ATPase GspE [Gammaproteobacteria bacterium]|nr:type II secretion system ATPase GspE [Gammaproteobacteria bacterium]